MWDKRSCRWMCGIIWSSLLWGCCACMSRLLSFCWRYGVFSGFGCELEEMVLGRDLEFVIWLFVEKNLRIGMLGFLE